MAKLGVNIDHVATLREARKGRLPDPVEAALACEAAGCDSIVCHLREDRRHIKDADVKKLRARVKTMLNLEMSVARSIVDIACRVKPDQATLVPERRQEITTEGGLDVARSLARVSAVVERLMKRGIAVSLFIDPAREQIEASYRSGARIIEFHTGEYANARTGSERKARLGDLERAVRHARSLGITVNAGHGLDYENAGSVAALAGMNELNIGHSIVSRAVFTGIGDAVEQMLAVIR